MHQREQVQEYYQTSLHWELERQTEPVPEYFQTDHHWELEHQREREPVYQRVRHSEPEHQREREPVYQTIHHWARGSIRIHQSRYSGLALQTEREPAWNSQTSLHSGLALQTEPELAWNSQTSLHWEREPQTELVRAWNYQRDRLHWELPVSIQSRQSQCWEQVLRMPREPELQSQCSEPELQRLYWELALLQSPQTFHRHSPWASTAPCCPDHSLRISILRAISVHRHPSRRVIE